MEKRDKKEKIVKEPTIESAKEDVTKNQEKQLRNLLIIMVLVILTGFIVFYMVQASKYLEYEGLSFQKMKQGELVFYDVKVPAINPLTGSVEGYYTMLLRNNPYDLEYIEMSGRNKFLRNITVSFSRNIEGCSDNLIGVANFAGFMSDAGFNVKGATTDESYAIETNLTYVTCENVGNQTVIVVQNASLGGPTRIRETVNDCYVIDVNQCETLPALEKFMLNIAVKSTKSE